MALMEFREPNRVKWVGTRPGHDGTQVLEYGDAAGAIVIVYTVPAGKTLYLCDATMMYATLAAGDGWAEISTAVPVTVTYLFRDILIAGIAVFTKQATYWPPIEIPSGYLIRVRSSAAGLTARLMVHGWVE